MRVERQFQLHDLRAQRAHLEDSIGEQAGTCGIRGFARDTRPVCGMGWRACGMDCS
jgi:hypothetical protein